MQLIRCTIQYNTILPTGLKPASALASEQLLLLHAAHTLCHGAGMPHMYHLCNTAAICTAITAAGGAITAKTRALTSDEGRQLKMHRGWHFRTTCCCGCSGVSGCSCGTAFKQ
jgi:hypothetical protein